MSRVLVVGPRDQLERAIESLYALKLVHLVDHRGEDEVFSIGKPLPHATEVSENLIKLRSIANLLKLEEASPRKRAEAEEDVRERIATLELHIREEDESRKKIEGLVQDLNRRVEDLRPFAALRLPLELYRGYESLAVIVGRIEGEVRGLDRVAPDSEVALADGVVAVFAPKESALNVREHLAKYGFAEIEVPKADGSPVDLLGRTEADRDKWVARLAEVQDRIAKLRDRYARFIIQTEERLQVEVEKAEAPLRFAVSEHSFVIDGWIPSSRRDALGKGLEGFPGVHVDVLEETAAHGEEAEGPPVLLRNRGPVRRFELLTKLYSAPQYDEADPTAFLFLLFPLFFGLMIGDAGYGIVMVILGAVLSMKLRNNPDFADLMRIILYGGVCAFFFGLIVFAEMFGIPFHAPHDHPDEANWSAILGYSIPYEALIHKLDPIGVVDMLLLSLAAAFIHLFLGYSVGFANEVRHDRKHAASRLGWLFVLVGLFGFFAVLARGDTHRISNILFFNQPPFVWIPPEGLPIGGMAMPWFSIASIVIGLVVLIPTEGPIAPLEIISLLANMMSYTRLAIVAVAKGAVALAFNSMLLPLLFGGDVLWIIVGAVFLFLAHAMVFLLGAMSAGIQSIRLNYVEFFLKFYKGGGTLFSPFGKRKSEVTT